MQHQRGHSLPPQSHLKICLPCAEIAPLGEAGGIADVTANLADQFVQAGHDCRVLVPLQRSTGHSALKIEDVAGLQGLELQLGGRSFAWSVGRTRLPGKAFDVYLLRCPQLFDTEAMYAGPDQHLRFILLCRAAIEMCQRLQFAPDIFHCHDWHTALVPVYLKTRYAWDQLFAASRSVLTIHNIGFQGVFGGGILYEMGLSGSPEMLDQDDLACDRVNFLKTGVIHADLLTTVSPTYAREILEPEQGMGLEQQLRGRQEALAGILNGVDYQEWNPEADPDIAAQYGLSRMGPKEQNKQALLEELGLEYAFDRPLVAMVGPLTYQSGIELVQQVMPDLLKSRPFSLLVAGHGEAHHERFCNWLQKQFPDRVSYMSTVDPGLLHRIQAGSDLLLMPSRYEPCGLNQMYGLRYGTVPVVRATGGLADSVRHFDPTSGAGTGIVFHDFDANGLRWALNTALDLYANKHAWRQLVFNGMQQDFSWQEQADRYIKRFRTLL
jgi:starch synthase